MAKLYLVDGYNVIFSSDLVHLPMERAREALVEIARTYAPDRVLVVFDGKREVIPPEPLKGAIFTKGESADEYIKAFVERRRDRSNLVVVTRDKSLAGYVRHLGARIMDPKAFLAGPSRPSKPASPPEKPPLSPDQEKQLIEELLRAWRKGNR